MTRVISIVSGKGGVGKTTLVSNLAHTLTELGKDVTAVDTNLTTPHLGIHLGFHLVRKSLHDFLRKDAKLKDIIYYHPYGFKVIPASLSVDAIVGADPDRLHRLAVNLTGKTDFVLFDSAPSLGKEALISLDACDEVLLLVNPNIPSVIDALKVANVAEKMDKTVLGVVVNRIKNKRNEISMQEIEDIIKYPVISEIPEDDNVQKSLAARTAVVDYTPQSSASIEMRRLAHYLIGRKFNYPKKAFFQRIFSWAFR